MQEFLRVCEQAARAAGQILLDWQERIHPQEKAPKDLVTEADLASQQAIQDILLGEFPDHGFLGEEDTEVAAKDDSEFRWIVDPLDGTTNYVHRLPGYSVSIALQHQGNVVVGVIYDPVANDCYSAVSGEGVRLNNEAAHVSQCTELSQALVAASLAANVDRNSTEVRRFIDVLASCQALRRLGSAALNLSYLASGRLDAYWATSVKTWDVAAGLLLVQEAGGVITGVGGGPFDLERPKFAAAATQQLHDELLATLCK